MPGRPRRGALGLRGRIVGAVLVTTVATLAVAALAVLGPLEHELRTEATTSLKNDLGKKELSQFKRIEPSLLLLLAVPSPPNTEPFRQAQVVRQELLSLRIELADKVGVTPTLVNLLGYPDRAGNGHVIPVPLDNDLIQPDTYGDATESFLTGRAVYGFGSINGTEYARAAVPVATADTGQRFVLAVRKPIEDIPAAVHVVRTAFLYAAAAGLALTLVLGIPLAATLVRRLRLLSQAALRVAQAGPGEEVPLDRARDEVGDLVRAFAIMERRLQHQEEARRAFVATASHELRTPLTSLEGML
jgi:HAMP domain-containing protein